MHHRKHREKPILRLLSVSVVTEETNMEDLKHIRLTEEYMRTIKFLALKYFNASEVRIFGSRADGTRKGGDIDIYIKTKKSKNILINKLLFLREFEKRLGQQKVDLIVEFKGSKKKNIYIEAKRHGVKI